MSLRTRLLALCVVLCGFVVIAAEPEPGVSKEDAARKAVAAKADDKKWTSLFDGKTLTGWKKPVFGTEGEIEVKDGAIRLGFGDGCTGVTLDKEFPKSGYEIELEARRFEGNDFFCGLTFPVEKSACTFVVGGWGGTLVGLSCLDGQDAANNDTSKFMDFKEKTWYKIRVRVIPERITTWIDDKETSDAKLKDREVSIRSEVELSKPLGITSWKTTADLRNIRYRTLTDAEKKAALPKEE
ncbi:MAG: DUF1080 domain-containing protein [Pirellulales bacterium]